MANRLVPGKIRIIGGSLRGSRLTVPDFPGLRPSADRVRETLFNWLAPHIAGLRALDLYAGTGALGLEAVSRGAREAVLVEREPALAQALAAAVERLKLPQARVLNTSAESFWSGAPQPFDLVFLDPPFAASQWDRAAAELEARGWLADPALVYVESPRALAPQMPRNWTLQRESHAGDVRFALYRRTTVPLEAIEGGAR
jgi:16S rRNA (guanine966-N2)-methyltransferase